MDVKNSAGPATIFVRSFNFTRLVTEINYEYQTVYIVWIGTHKAYDKIDVKTVEYDG